MYNIEKDPHACITHNMCDEGARFDVHDAAAVRSIARQNTTPHKRGHTGWYVRRYIAPISVQ